MYIKYHLSLTIGIVNEPNIVEDYKEKGRDRYMPEVFQQGEPLSLEEL